VARSRQRRQRPRQQFPGDRVVAHLVAVDRLIEHMDLLAVVKRIEFLVGGGGVAIGRGLVQPAGHAERDVARQVRRRGQAAVGVARGHDAPLVQRPVGIREDGGGGGRGGGRGGGGGGGSGGLRGGGGGGGLRDKGLEAAELLDSGGVGGAAGADEAEVEGVVLV